MLEVRPSPDSVAAVPTSPEPATVDADPNVGPAPETIPEAPEVDPPDPPAGAGREFTTCRESRILGCDALYVRMLETSPDLCVQLVLDNCNSSDRSSLGVDVPVSWRLASASVSSNPECDVREYDLESQPALTGTGTIRWDLQSRQISGLEIDVNFRVAASEMEPTLPTQVSVRTSSALPTVTACED